MSHPNQAPARNKLITWLTIIIAATLTVCLCLGLVATLSRRNRTQPAQPQPTATLEVILPTSPPPPTVTPPPAPPNDNLRAYVTILLDTVIAFTRSLKELDAYFILPLLDDLEWQAAVTARLIIIDNKHQTLQAITPPPQVAEMHQNLLIGINECADLALDMRTHMKNRDIKQLQAYPTITLPCAQKIVNSFNALTGIITDDQ